MTKLSKSAFISTYTTVFADNTNRDITEEDMRNFMQDLSDSCIFIAEANAFVIRGDFTPSTGMPTSSVLKYQVFIATDYANINGVDVGPGTWCIAKINNATDASADGAQFNDWYLK